MSKFYLDDYLKQEELLKEEVFSSEELEESFFLLCDEILAHFEEEWNRETQGLGNILDIQKRAIIGYEKEVSYFKDKIRLHLKEHGQEKSWFPKYYESIEDAIYHQNWGLAGLAQWFGEEYQESSSAKIIGDRIYFMEAGKMVLKSQRINHNRREQLVRALMLRTPEERMDKDFHELYLLDGTRITIYSENLTKKTQDTIILRRYIIPDYSFEEQAKRHTIPEEAIPLFQNMVRIGYNVAFVGAVRSAKTTFLSTWQSYENQDLEGVLVETDPEIPLHKMMERAPIIQIVADNERLKHISKNLMRSDADYFVLAEARDGIALDMAVRIANKGVRRMKMTFHASDPQDFCYDVASEITRNFDVELESVFVKVAKSFHYIFHFVQLSDKSQKRLKGIYEICPASTRKEIQIKPICQYQYKEDTWKWHYHMGKDKWNIGIEEDADAWYEFDRCLQGLAEKGGEEVCFQECL